MIKQGSLIKIINKPDSCCGVLCLDFRDKVEQIITHIEKGNILILESGAIVWESDVEELI